MKTSSTQLEQHLLMLIFGAMSAAGVAFDDEAAKFRSFLGTLGLAAFEDALVEVTGLELSLREFPKHV